MFPETKNIVGAKCLALMISGRGVKLKIHVEQVFSLLYRYPSFGRLWIGRLISLCGNAFTLIALPWFVLHMTGSGMATAGILLTLQLPSALTSTFIGSMFDRFQPRSIMLIDNGVRAFIIGLVPILYWLGILKLWQLFLLTSFAGLLAPAMEVGARRFLPDLVTDQDLEKANMLWSFSTNLSLVVGPTLAGILVASFGGPSVLFIDAGTFGLMAIVAATLPIISGHPTQVPAQLSKVLGLNQLWNIKVVRYTTLLSLVFFFSYGPLEAALPVYGSAILQTDASGFGLLWSALALGSLLGTLGSTTLSRRLRVGVALPAIALLWGASLLPIVFTHNLWFACTFLLIGGLIWGPYIPTETTLIQRNVPKEQLGRVFGARSTVLTGGTPMGLAAGGILLAFTPSTIVIALSAVACISVGVCALVSPAFQNLLTPAKRVSFLNEEESE